MRGKTALLVIFCLSLVLNPFSSQGPVLLAAAKNSDSQKSTTTASKSTGTQTDTPPATAAPTTTPTASSGKISLSRKKLTLSKGTRYTLKILNTKKKGKWASSNSKVVSVKKKKGILFAKKKGTTVITARVGKKKFTCKVAVVAPLGRKDFAVYFAANENTYRNAISYFRGNPATAYPLYFYPTDKTTRGIYMGVSEDLVESSYGAAKKISLTESVKEIYKKLFDLSSAIYYYEYTFSAKSTKGEKNEVYCLRFFIDKNHKVSSVVMDVVNNS